MTNCSIWQLSWDARYELSRENAMKTVELQQPITMFWCLVEDKYKETIWNEAIKKVEAKKHQLELEYNYEQIKG